MKHTRMRRRARALGPNVWVVRRGDGFSIKEEGTNVFLTPAITQAIAVPIARAIARGNRSELIVQGRDGRIVKRDSHGCDPFPPRG